MDYIGEPTPFDVFPVKSSYFGAVDTAGFPKDAFHLFRSQWTKQPMVHLLPMDWTGHEPGETVQVRAYANAESVELFLNGRSLGVRSFDAKTTTDGRAYLETTEATGDDKTVTSGPLVPSSRVRARATASATAAGASGAGISPMRTAMARVRSWPSASHTWPTATVPPMIQTIAFCPPTVTSAAVMPSGPGSVRSTLTAP